MILRHSIFFVLIALLTASCNRNKLSLLEQGFDTPPDEARAGVYWYFMDGNLTAEGMTKDLEAMQKAGIGYVLFLEVNVGVPRGKVDYMSDEWQQLFVHAVRECERLGIRMVLGVGPGWNGSGGPWVEGSQSMRHLVSSSIEVQGGKGIQTITLPVPSAKQPFFGKSAFTPESLKKWEEYYEDVAVLAFPINGGVTQIDTGVVSGNAYLRIPEIDERALYYRKPYSSVSGIPQYIPIYDYLASHKGDKAIDKSKITELTSLLQPDGSLKWEVPAGQWLVMRFGARNNGAATRPAPLPGVGFEADKMDTTAMIAHFSNFTDKLFHRLGFTQANQQGGGINSLHIDSWEMGAQNWTEHFREEFKSRRGYDPLPYYPVYSGLMVQSREVSERFLWDLRLTAQELVADKHVGFVRRYAHKYGLELSIEPYDMNPAADMELAAAADIPMAEFWGSPEEFHYKGYITAWGATEASSVANLTGQRVVPAEAFTAHGDGWKQYPASVKNQGDWAFAAGINRLMYHTFQHQPLPDNLRPGMTMGPYGLHWDRNQTWWYLSDAYHLYISRCQYMLQQGRTVADVLYLAPEGAPYVFRAPESAYCGADYVPDKKGYNFDGCPPSLLYQATVQDGRIVFPSGASYRLLILPNFKTMRPELLAKIVELVREGATVAGVPPVQSPSLSNYPLCDAEVKRLAKELWGDLANNLSASNNDVYRRTYGKGKVIYSRAFEDNADNLYPNYEFTIAELQPLTPPDFTTDGEVRYIHKTRTDYDYWFLSSRTDKEQDAVVTLRISGLQPELWHPVTGERRLLHNYNENNGTTTIQLHFDAYESYFIVFRHSNDDTAMNETDSTSTIHRATIANTPSLSVAKTLSEPWQVSFDTSWGGPGTVIFDKLIDWSKHENDSIKYYSGTAYYRTAFELTDKPGTRLYLNLGKVKNMARITLNGKDLGVVWTAPWQVEITSAVKRGVNKLTVEVVNLWANRLIGDEQLPDDGIRDGKYPEWLLNGDKRPSKRFTFTTYRHYRSTSPLLESGLLGPVTILSEH
jgi:hypothetical protein